MSEARTHTVNQERKEIEIVPIQEDCTYDRLLRMMLMSNPGRPIIIVDGGDFERPRSLWKLIALAAILFGGFLFVHNASPLYADWLWFKETGYSNVFTTTIVAKSTLYIVFALIFFAVFYGNLYLAQRLAPESGNRILSERFGVQISKMLMKGLNWILLAIGAFMSLWAGRLVAEGWASWLEFTHSTTFNQKDPVFGHDLSFYVFQLPFWRLLYQFGISTLLLTLASVSLLYFAGRAVETLTGLSKLAPGIKIQILSLLAALALVQAFGTRLASYELLTSDNHKFFGAGFTDLHYRLFGFNAQMILLVLTALACIVTLFRGKDLRFPLAGVAAWGVSWLICGLALPGIIQKTYVEPNEFSVEKEYIERNIKFTRMGFGLENVKRVNEFPADQSLTAKGIAENKDTLDNVRLWDYPYIAKVYSQLQTVKSYYKFESEAVGGGRSYNIDVDRYQIGGRLRQVMLGGRELDTSGLPDTAQSWQNQRLAYTHGYGVVMSPVNRTIQGLPDYFLSGFPVVASPEASNLKVTQPAIYYGQIEHSYVFTNTEQPEFDFPSSGNGDGAKESQDHYSRYAGAGGVPIGSNALARWAFSIMLGDPNILLTRSFTPETKLLYRRDIRDRIQTVASFVQQDSDPYLIVDTGTGKLVWMVDCYTISSEFPYSTPEKVSLSSQTYIATNYIRNSIKATVDAYDGTVNLYLADAKDPIAQTYAKIYPGLLKPISLMPASLRAHTRYPEDIFRLQRSVYATFHVDDPRVFYSRDDTWAIPTEPNAQQSPAKSDGSPTTVSEQQMDPYYVIMKLPGDRSQKSSQTNKIDSAVEKSQEEFLLMSPLAPIKREKQNILGWMCARCDGDNYGQLVLYRFPQHVSVNGPSQVIAYINNDPVISPQLTPLRLAGSNANFGNLLVIPVQNSLLYIAPLYVESTTGATGLPKLEKVVVAYGDRVTMGATLEKAMADMFPSGGNVVEEGTSPPVVENSSNKPVAQAAVPQNIRNLIQKAGVEYSAAQQKLKAGDFAGYGLAIKAMERELADLKKAAGIEVKPQK